MVGLVDVETTPAAGAAVGLHDYPDKPLAGLLGRRDRDLGRGVGPGS
jgi:hypothetical protein